VLQANCGSQLTVDLWSTWAQAAVSLCLPFNCTCNCTTPIKSQPQGPKQSESSVSARKRKDPKDFYLLFRAQARRTRFRFHSSCRCVDTGRGQEKGRWQGGGVESGHGWWTSLLALVLRSSGHVSKFVLCQCRRIYRRQEPACDTLEVVVPTKRVGGVKPNIS